MLCDPWDNPARLEVPRLANGEVQGGQANGRAEICSPG